LIIIRFAIRYFYDALVLKIAIDELIIIVAILAFALVIIRFAIRYFYDALVFSIAFN